MDRRIRRALMERLNRDGEKLAARFELRYLSITAERANVTSRYGSCCEDGGIKIRLLHAVTGQSLKYSSLVNTLCHELAHLRFFDHGERFRRFYREILEYARAERLYRPAPLMPPRSGTARPALPEPAGPVQLTLF
jgi:predicted metal-dependent hydrolase